MERLTVNDLNKVCYDPWELCGMDRYCKKGCHEKGGCTKGCHILKMYRKLAEYEDLEEQGKLLKLPCAVGDTVWYWDKEYDPIEEAPFEGYISGYEIVSAKTIYIIINPKSNFKSWFPCDVKLEIDDFGKTVFLTREEAEATLKELRDKKG